jgi:hypothetical protein
MTSPPNGVRARSLSGRALLATLGLWFLLSALGGAGTVFVARSLASAWGFDSNNVTPVIVAEVYAALVFAAVIVLGRRVQTVTALNPAPGRWFVLVFGALGIAYALTAFSMGCWRRSSVLGRTSLHSCVPSARTMADSRRCALGWRQSLCCGHAVLRRSARSCCFAGCCLHGYVSVCRLL